MLNKCMDRVTAHPKTTIKQLHLFQKYNIWVSNKRFLENSISISQCENFCNSKVSLFIFFHLSRHLIASDIKVVFTVQICIYI